jgi:hypothetical protein
MFLKNQFLHDLSIFILIIFEGIEANYLYVYQTNLIKKISHMNCFLHFIVIRNLVIQNATQKIKWYKDTIQSITQHSYVEKIIQQVNG